ncbi:hypothetical protein HDU93_000939 [Gonapodya sp. JEL0774]|nr:hypothetical protein HDU93_000939 [Gonapodya sp. JEL0774]
MSRRGRNDPRDGAFLGTVGSDRPRPRPARSNRAVQVSWRQWFSANPLRPLAVASGCLLLVAAIIVTVSPKSDISALDGAADSTQQVEHVPADPTAAFQGRTFIPRSKRPPTFKRLSDTGLHRLLSPLSNLSRFDPADPSSLIAPILVPRVSGTPENAAVKDFIADFFRNTLAGNWSVDEDSFEDTTPFGLKKFTNVIATKDPASPRRIVVAAHFDSKYFEQFDFLGATDSAAPCAILLDVAAALDPLLEARSKRTEGSPDVTLQFIFFDGEEAFRDWTATDSIYGSRHLAARWEAEPNPCCLSSGDSAGTMIESIDMLVLLDLLGSPSPRIHNSFANTASVYGRLRDAQRRVEAKAQQLARNRGASYTPVNTFFTDDPSSVSNYGVADDHLPFLALGVPILHLIPVPFPSVWHTEGDNAAALDLETIDAWSRVMRVWCAEELGLEVGVSRVLQHGKL